MKKHAGMESVISISEIELVYKSKAHAADRAIVTTSCVAAQLLLPYFDAQKMELQEQAMALYLNRRNQVLGIYRISIGGISETVMDVRLILAAALKLPTVFHDSGPFASLWQFKAKQCRYPTNPASENWSVTIGDSLAGSPYSNHGWLLLNGR